MSIRVFRQGAYPTCGPRALQTAFAFFKVHPSFSEIKSACLADDSGTYLEYLAIAARKFNFETVVKRSTASVLEIKRFTDRGLPVLVNWFVGREDGGDKWHTAVAYQVDEEYVFMLDSASYLFTEPVTLIRRSKLARCWKKHEDSRWMLALVSHD